MIRGAKMAYLCCIIFMSDHRLISHTTLHSALYQLDPWEGADCYCEFEFYVVSILPRTLSYDSLTEFFKNKINTPLFAHFPLLFLSLSLSCLFCVAHERVKKCICVIALTYCCGQCT
jgi:hypothetical protein